MNSFLRACVLAVLVAALPAPAAANESLRPGEVSIAVSRQGPPTDLSVPWWEPRVGIPLQVTAHARLTRAQVRARARLFIRYREGRRPCGPRASDSASGRLFAVIDRTGPDTVRHAARTPTVRFRAAGNVRFCSWIARKASDRTRAVVQDIEAYDRLFGAAIRVEPSGGGWTPIKTEARSTHPFQFAIGGDCPTGSTRNATSEPPNPSPYGDALYRHTSVWWGLCPVTTWSFEAGSLSLTGDERAADPPPVRGFGNGCVIGHWKGESVFEATRYLHAVGCRVGRVRFSPAPPGSRAGAVYGADVHGVNAALVPRGTAVNLIVDGRPSSQHASAAARTVIQRYGGKARAGERVLTSYAGPVVPALPGVVLLRYFIPSRLAAGGLLKGDGRGYTADRMASYRVALLWDTTTGKVVFRVTESCYSASGKRKVEELVGAGADPGAGPPPPHGAPPPPPPPLKITVADCQPALKILDVARDAVWRDSDTIRRDNLVSIGSVERALRVRVSVVNSLTAYVPLGAWSVDNELVVTPTAAGFSTAIEGNGYPAIEGYFYPTSGGVQNILRRDIERPVVGGRGPLSDGENGGNAALDGKSWADCVTEPVSLRSMTCTNRRNGQVWRTDW